MIRGFQDEAELDAILEHCDKNNLSPSIQMTISIENAKDLCDPLVLQQLKAVHNKIQAECDMIMTMTSIDVSVSDAKVEYS